MDTPEQKNNSLSAILSHSPMPWAYTNLLKEYDFSDEKHKDTDGIRLPKIAAYSAQKSGVLKSMVIND